MSCFCFIIVVHYRQFSCNDVLLINPAVQKFYQAQLKLAHSKWSYVLGNKIVIKMMFGWFDWLFWSEARKDRSFLTMSPCYNLPCNRRFPRLPYKNVSQNVKIFFNQLIKRIVQTVIETVFFLNCFSHRNRIRFSFYFHGYIAVKC